MAARCAACAALREALKAKDQTITVLADLVDTLRQGEPLPTESNVVPIRKFTGGGERLWISDEEEELVAAMAEGVISHQEGEERLAAVQAMNQQVHVE